MEIKVKKSLGQNFLTDKNIIKSIVDIGFITDNDVILEVGPGTGNLTEFIFKKNPKQIYAVEKDYNLVNFLNEKFEGKIKIINEDILNFKINNISNEKFIIYGNLPYNISTQILTQWIVDQQQFSSIKKLILMFQKEVAERISSTTGKKRGILSVLIQVFYKVEYCLTISENSFNPPPKVKSAVIKLTRNRRRKLDCNEKLFKQIIKSAYNQRRKTLRNALKSFNLKMNDEINHLLTLRAEKLSVEDFIKITKSVC